MTETAKPLTPRQRQVLVEIQRYLADKGYPPTLRELAEALDVQGTTAVNYHLQRLEAKGWLERDPGVSRGLRLIEDRDFASGEAEASGFSATERPPRKAPIL